ncbi:MAG: DUF2156 domain-containing protein [Methanoculleaceae archaeon]
MRLSGDEFQPVTLDDRALFSGQYRRFPQAHSDNLFSTMVCWNHYAEYRYLRTGRNLLLSTTIDGETSFRYPIGPSPSSVLPDLLRMARDEGGTIPLFFFDRVSVQDFSRQYPRIPVFEYRDFFDYIYSSDELATLPGREYLTIRKQINKFHRECRYSLEPMTAMLTEEVLGFLKEWCEWKHCEEQPLLNYEKGAVLFAVEHFEDIGLEGLVLRVDGAIRGLSLFTRQNPETAVIHFEKALPECPGAYKVINQETARFLAPRYPCCNRESDLGVQGLRKAKLRYHPHHFARVWYIRGEGLE